MHVNNSSVHFCCCCCKSKENILAKRRWNTGTRTRHDVSTEMCLSVFVNDCDTNANVTFLFCLSVLFFFLSFFLF